MTMGASIVLTGLAANDPVPGTYLETNFAQGPATGSDGELSMLVLANKLAAGSGTLDSVIYGPDTQVPLQTEADMIALAGTGSEAHRMFRRIAAVTRGNGPKVYWCFVTQSAGAQATATITYTTSATANGSTRFQLDEEFVEAAITSGDTVTTIAAAIVAAINTKTHWPVTASNISGVVTVTARQAGLRGNLLRFQASISSGIGTTVSPTIDTAFSGGTTADSSTTALATISPNRFYYIVSAAEDATQFGALLTQVDANAAPTVGLRQRCFAGSVDTLSNVNTIATGRNGARAEVVWSEKSPWTPAELAANAAAIYALFETKPNPRTNFANFGNDAKTAPYWKVPKSRTASAIPSRTSIKSALNNGVSPIGVNTNGTTYLVNRITTRSLSGAVADYRIRDAHKVTICDFFADDVQAKTVLQMAGKRIGNDPAGGQAPPGPDVVTPIIYKGLVFGVIDTYARNDLLQNVAQIKSGTDVQRETSPTTRMSARVPLQPVDNALQFAVAVDQVAGILLAIGGAIALSLGWLA